MTLDHCWIAPDYVWSNHLQYQMKFKGTAQRCNARAWDVGASAGVSTEKLRRMGYRQIEAIDWSTKAWMKNVEEEGINPKGVVFTAMDDETFVDKRIRPEEMEKFDTIVFNFGVNERKAIKYAKEFLNEDGRLLAPVNKVGLLAETEL